MGAGECLSDLKPLWKYSWPDGQQVYVSQVSGDVVQFTTTASRRGAYFGAILGLVVGVWMYSPCKRYRNNDIATAIPYRHWKRWHMIIGLVFGAAAVTWTFSGMLSMVPLPAQRSSGTSAGRARDALMQCQPSS